MRRFDDLLRASGALGKMTLRHSCVLPDGISQLNAH
jgi:hypothetical protein